MNHKHGSYYKRLESLLYIPILAILDYLWRSEVLDSSFRSPAKRGVNQARRFDYANFGDETK